jgi:hypothetical protein
VVTHRARLALLAASAAVVPMALASCGAVDVVGTVAGTATSCSGAPVVVSVLSDGAVSRTLTFRPGQHFSFHLSPGHYVLRAGGTSRHVTMLAGTTQSIDFHVSCAP